MPKRPVIKRFMINVLLAAIPILATAQTYNETGRCSYYADKFQGRNTAGGEKYDKDQFTAAHRTLPFNTLVRVTNLHNNKSVIVRINDRGPNTGNRLIDLSKAAAVSIDMIAYGVIDARVEYVGMANADSIRQILAAQKAEAAKKLELARDREKEMKKAEVKKPVNVNLSSLEDKAFYDQDFKSSTPGGFGVQVGFFSNLSNCRNAMHHFEGKYAVRSFMYVEKRKDGTYYRLTLGQFSNKASAERLRKLLIGEAKDCFVVDYSQMK
jgi:rare lipoprotein A